MQATSRAIAMTVFAAVGRWVYFRKKPRQTAATINRMLVVATEALAAI